MAVRADVHRVDPESLLDTGAAPRLQVWPHTHTQTHRKKRLLRVVQKVLD